ncbi:MAG: FecR domain-containing protein [Cyclobacteriaceae bacterium]
MYSELGKKFFNNECTPEEARQFLEWFYSEEGKQSIEEQVDEAWTQKAKYHWDKELLFEKIDSLKDQSDLSISHNLPLEREIKNEESAKSRSMTYFSSWKIAASLTILIGIAVLFTLPKEEEVKIVQKEFIEKRNPAGQKSIIRLPDGSKVTLNAESSIRYLSKFTAEERMIELKGEAFFEVAKDSLRPFRVKSEDIVTSALGTSFNIRSYEDDNDVKVSLVTGKVVVEDKDNIGQFSIKLIPGDGLAYNKCKKTISSFKADLSSLKAWRDGILQFQNSEFSQMVKTLERWYGVKIKGEGIQGTFTGTFNNQSLEAVLKGLSYSFVFDYEINEKNVTLLKK